MNKNNDVISGATFVTLSMLIFAVSFQIPASQHGLSPAAFPRFIAACIFILGIIQVKASMKGGGEQHKAHDESNESIKSYVLRVLVFLVSCFLYINSLKIFGFVIVTPLLVAVTMYLFNERKWLRIASVSILTTVLLYSIFRIIFRVPLPRSLFW
ncbi:tripartite tricarboxylate transporter TctB family protein [Oceanispirochaeta crateris]|uniref:Tripartite tricarboxylate transporter TctB family protein n=1 Tax=Oceanispirochaeta crateris TaxID=2518645 RepID=A0A5C1QF58_9SPIO|nr:tripartite tricarboxylate transporter TctB family protein [Oceanispirochaeta crateris]QEN06743.1 tripartite tricarboxylate transporter TctB family protein [Oceanispirochaeta crateris]